MRGATGVARGSALETFGTRLSRDALADVSALRRTSETQRNGLSSARPPRVRSLRSHLIGLVLLVMLPSIAISMVTAFQSVRDFRRIYELELQNTAKALATAVDEKIETLSAALTVLALSPELDAGGDLIAFHRRASDVAKAFGSVIRFRRPDGTVVVDTAVSAGTPPRLSSNIGALMAAMRRPGVSVGDVVRTGKSGARQVLVRQPVTRDNQVIGLLDVVLYPTALAAILSAESGGRSVIVDAQDTIIARAPAPLTSASPTLSSFLSEAIARRPSGLLEAPGAESAESAVAFVRPTLAPNWAVLVCEPVSVFDSSWRAPLAARLGACVAALALAISAAAWLGRGLSRPLTALTAHAQASAYGSEPPATLIPPSSVSEFEALRISLERAETVLRRRGAAERMALQEARTGHELLASVVNGTADLIYVKDHDLCFVLANRAALAMGGEPREEWQVLGRRSLDLIPFEPAIAEEALDREVIATGELRSVNVEWASSGGGEPAATPDGTPAAGRLRIFALTKTPWRDAEGAICGVVTVARDVTRQRAAETRLTAVQGELLRASRLSAMGAMASGLAHELNQPLAAATNFLNAAARLLDRIGETPPITSVETARTAVQQAAQQTLRAGGIVRRLRDFIGRGEAELRVEDMADLIREACEVARADGAGRRSQLVVKVSAEAGVALADRTQMQQVLLNLIRNAGEALLDQANGRIEVTAGPAAAGGVEITVADNGPGLSETVAAKLFQPFVSTKTNGMGIGLAICGTIVEGHGGRLNAERSPSGGALFRIVLPAVEPANDMQDVQLNVQDRNK